MLKLHARKIAEAKSRGDGCESIMAATGSGGESEGERPREREKGERRLRMGILKGETRINRQAGCRRAGADFRQQRWENIKSGDFFSLV